MRRYPPIAEHGLVGDLRTAALVSADGVVNWFCAPRFDSPSLFAALLDHQRGGYFAVTVDGPDVTTRQLYLPDTAALVTRFLSRRGVGEVVDFMPVDRAERADGPRRLVRLLRVVRGELPFSVACRPRFDYGRARHAMELRSVGEARFTVPGGPVTARLTACGPIALERDEAGGREAHGGREAEDVGQALRQEDIRARLVLRQGEQAGLVLEVAPAGPREEPPPPSLEALDQELHAVRHFWHHWVRKSRYRGRWQQLVNRSAITLKLLTYAPTGAPVAAATMGLPEQIGGERNWDYRYTWIRDASLSAHTLLDLGFTEEAEAYRHWLGERLRAGTAGGAGGGTVTGEPLQIMYRVDGDPHLSEEVLPHLEGYRGSAPVRLGNAAADQLQLDIYGEAVNALTRSARSTQTAGYDGWLALSGLLDWLTGAWDRPDEGIWETRGGPRHFTYSRVMSWTAFDRGIRLASDLARPADLAAWTAARDAVLRQVMERGWSARRQAFVQHYDGEVLDASLLLMPAVGFVSPRDPRWLSTLDAMESELVTDSLVHRYDPAAAPDGLRGGEGTFSLCSFLYVNALAQAGRLGQARYAFDKMTTYANHVGLYAEEIGPTGEQLGNFPQAFTHLALIAAVLSLDTELDRIGA
ncbi:glycoside hydrolase family 15 protein [Streptomyces alkaliterrae]|uniref:Glycoside hydrolase family 15 protein n=1 Tax=Streptomyces alkaliterrae TaxID=2213162 RepID=A0A5P0YY45_9ACTN|nr:glycoside hydrolase family 15 protein [Streptomyces alkaliterrae]MBB1262232.1 glycoside hydrolase family 15 protein [Streptomyces alkaliterrae]MQS05216.1 glycoside hydrolase family 15 protein [Streptomyces alkaliterrae]